MDNNTAAEIVTRLTYIAAGSTSTWFSGGPPNGGCGGSSGYMNYLAADDDNGNLNNGTPHMTGDLPGLQRPGDRLRDADGAGFRLRRHPDGRRPTSRRPRRHLDGPLLGTAVSGATSYEVFRAEGIFASATSAR